MRDGYLTGDLDASRSPHRHIVAVGLHRQDIGLRAAVHRNADQTRRGVGVRQRYGVVAGEPVEGQIRLVGELDVLEAVNGNLAPTGSRAGRVAERIAATGPLDGERVRRDGIDDGLETSEGDRLRRDAVRCGEQAFVGARADRVGLGIAGAGPPLQDESVRAGLTVVGDAVCGCEHCVCGIDDPERVVAIAGFEGERGERVEREREAVVEDKRALVRAPCGEGGDIAGAVTLDSQGLAGDIEQVDLLHVAVGRRLSPLQGDAVGADSKREARGFDIQGVPVRVRAAVDGDARRCGGGHVERIVSIEAVDGQGLDRGIADALALRA